jgi:hypothetical protein
MQCRCLNVPELNRVFDQSILRLNVCTEDGFSIALLVDNLSDLLLFVGILPFSSRPFPDVDHNFQFPFPLIRPVKISVETKAEKKSAL